MAGEKDASFTKVSNNFKHLLENDKVMDERMRTFYIDERSAKNELKWAKTLKKACVVFSLLSLFVGSVSVSCVMYSTNVFQQILSDSLILRNHTFRYEMWRQSPLEVHFSIYLFNFTNVVEFENGDYNKLIVQELGPYVYREQIEKVNVSFNENGTITYQERKIYTFLPHISNGTMDDVIIVPNIPLMGGVALVKDTNYFKRWGFSTFLRSMNSNPFISLKAEDFIWGYEDNFFTVAKSFMQFNSVDVPYNKFGIMASKNGTGKEVNTIFTGASDLRKMGSFSSYKGKSDLSVWNTDSCNKMEGTDASMFSPLFMDKQSILTVYNKDMCRKFPLVYNSSVTTSDGLKADRYVFHKDVFQYPQESCYCHDVDICPPSGVFNASTCVFGAPVFISFPHFLHGDDSLFEFIEGLKPDASKHSTHVDLHPRMAFPLGGNSRFQVNIMAHPATGIMQMTSFDKPTILPVAWMDLTIVSMSPLTSFLTWCSLGLDIVAYFLQYGLILIAVICLYILYRIFSSKKSAGYLNRNISNTHQNNIYFSEKL